jgi:hypothetical protein
MGEREAKDETNRLSAQVVAIIPRAKRKPRPMIIPYPNAWERGAVVVVMVGLSQTLFSPPDQEDIISNPGAVSFQDGGYRDQ